MRRFNYSHSVYICLATVAFSQTDVSATLSDTVFRFGGRPLTQN